MQKKNFPKFENCSLLLIGGGGPRGVSVNSLPRYYDRSVGSLAGEKLMLRRVQKKRST
jgi:hypothetical protein